MTVLTWVVAAVVTDDAGRVLLCRQGSGGRWALPGGRLHRAECPPVAVVRDIRAETGWDVELVDLVGLYRLTHGESGTAGRPSPLPDVLVHVFRARANGDRPAGEPAGGCRLRWHPPIDLPEVLTPITGAALADALAGRSGVLRDAPPEPRPMPAPDRPGSAVSPEPAPPAQRTDRGGAPTSRGR